MANGYLAVQHMSQQQQMATFTGMKDTAQMVSLKTELIDHVQHNSIVNIVLF